MFRHCIFTNFGVGITDEIWLAYRLGVFQNTVLPSIRAQRGAAFEWHIFVDERLPQLHRIQLESLLPGQVPTRIHAVRSYVDILPRVRALMDRDSPNRPVITSRIDDDDCLCVDAIQRIQTAAAGQMGEGIELGVIALRNGIEHLTVERIGRPVDHESIAIGLSLFDAGSGRRPELVSGYAHHTIVDTLRASGRPFSYTGLTSEQPLYLYNRHPISDSYYFGARSRILGDPNRAELTVSQLSHFGLEPRHADSLSAITRTGPHGQPFKHLEKLDRLRKEIAAAAQDAPATSGDPFRLDWLTYQMEQLERTATRRNPRRHATAPVRVAILGSCVTRDLFEVQKAALPGIEVCFYGARSSMISALSPPCIDPRIRVGQQRFEASRAAMDLDKSMWDRLGASRPDVVLIDLIDERIGLIAHGGTWVTASQPTVEAFERSQVPFTIVRPWSPEAMRLRQWAAPHYIDRIRSICPTVILHEARWATDYITPDQSRASFDGSEFETLIRLNNSVIDEAIRHFQTSAAPLDSIGGAIDGRMLAGGDHRWSFTPFHYDASYYALLARQLLARLG